METKNIWKKLAEVQSILDAPKNQYNSFGKYNYRSCEDILAAAKPLCIEKGLVLTIYDEIVLVGERYYVEATATIIEISTGNKHFVKAKAREPLTKKGMDEPQITGTASSYSRKYALNGLFAIDDTKDADTNEYKAKQKIGNEISKIEDEKKKLEDEKKKLEDEKVKATAELEKLKEEKEALNNPIEEKQLKRINILIKDLGIDTKDIEQKKLMYDWLEIESLKTISAKRAAALIIKLQKAIDIKKQKQMEVTNNE